VAVRAGGATTLVVPGSQRGRYALNYASRDGGHARPIAAVGKGQNAVRLTPCPPETPTFRRTGTVGEWTAFSGGFIIRGSGCVTVDAYVPGRRRPLSARIRFDARRSACS
jgi:hypothetical protein